MTKDKCLAQSMSAADLQFICRNAAAAGNIPDIAAWLGISERVASFFARPPRRTRRPNKPKRAGYISPVAGEGNHQSKLMKADVIAIRRRCHQGEAQTAVAADYGVDPSHVSRIVDRQFWKSISAAPGEVRKTSPNRPQAKLTPDTVREARQRRATGEKLASLAKAFGVSIATMGACLQQKTWKHVK